MNTQDIVTERLVLRSMTVDDAAFAWTLWGDRESGKYLADPFYESAEVLAELLSDIE